MASIMEKYYIIIVFQIVSNIYRLTTSKDQIIKHEINNPYKYGF